MSEVEFSENESSYESQYSSDGGFVEISHLTDDNKDVEVESEPSESESESSSESPPLRGGRVSRAATRTSASPESESEFESESESESSSEQARNKRKRKSASEESESESESESEAESESESEAESESESEVEAPSPLKRSDRRRTQTRFFVSNPSIAQAIYEDKQAEKHGKGIGFKRWNSGGRDGAGGGEQEALFQKAITDFRRNGANWWPVFSSLYIINHICPLGAIASLAGRSDRKDNFSANHIDRVCQLSVEGDSPKIFKLDKAKHDVVCHFCCLKRTGSFVIRYDGTEKPTGCYCASLIEAIMDLAKNYGDIAFEKFPKCEDDWRRAWDSSNLFAERVVEAQVAKSTSFCSKK